MQATYYFLGKQDQFRSFCCFGALKASRLDPRGWGRPAPYSPVPLEGVGAGEDVTGLRTFSEPRPSLGNLSGSSPFFPRIR